jgi:hypothetical protein
MALTLLGEEFRIYLDTSANHGATVWATPTWVEQKNVGDIGLDRAPKSAEIKKRGSSHTKYKQGRFDQRLTLSVNYKEDDALVEAIEAAIAAKTDLHIAVADGVIATIGTNYWHADYTVVGCPLSGTFDEGSTIELELAPWADSINEPAKVSVTV